MKAIQSYRRGESHEAAGKPIQDCSLAESTDLITIGVVCDGHGGDRYFRSNFGAQYAVDATRKCAEEFVRNADEGLFSDASFTQRGTAEDAKKEESVCSDVRDVLFRQLFASIIYDWQERVIRHAKENPVSESERKTVPDEYIEAFEKTDGQGERTGIEKTYGCTLICFVQARSYWFAFHIGDGKCISFSTDDAGHISWKEPVPWDDKCFLNKTTSLCNEDAINEFRYCYGGKGTFPLAVFLGSDGIDDSFGEDTNLVNFYVQVLKKIVSSSPEDARIELDNTLPKLSVHGSKDDKSVVCCFDDERLKLLRRGLIEWQCKNVKDSIDAIQKGSSEPSDSPEMRRLVFKYTKLHAELGDPGDYLKLARFYENGEGVSQNYSEAVGWYTKAADKGNAEAQLELGERYYKVRKYSEAAKWYLKAAVQGIPKAQYQLGLMHSQGNGIERDYKKAVDWYRKAAVLGNADAQMELAGMFEAGKGVGQSYAEAEMWYKKAAAQGSARAQYLLGCMYEYGKGVVQSNTLAFKLYQESADRGYAQAKYSLGSMYEYGIGVSQDDETAIELYREAADKEIREAQRHLGYLYSSGIGVEQDFLEAEKWCLKAAQQGDAAAQTCLGEMYYYKKGIRQDFAEALKWLSAAARQGNAQAQYLLGKMYRDGNGVTPDPNLAFKWYSMSVENGNSEALEAIDDKLLKDVGKEGGSSFLKRLKRLLKK